MILLHWVGISSLHFFYFVEFLYAGLQLQLGGQDRVVVKASDS